MLVYEYDCSTCENDCAHQASYWTAISLAAGQSSGGAARQHERAEAVFCHRRCMGTLAAAAMPVAAHSVAPSAGAVPDWSGAAAFGHAAGGGGAGGPGHAIS